MIPWKYKEFLDVFLRLDLITCTYLGPTQEEVSKGFVNKYMRLSLGLELSSGHDRWQVMTDATWKRTSQSGPGLSNNIEAWDLSQEEDSGAFCPSLQCGYRLLILYFSPLSWEIGMVGPIPEGIFGLSAWRVPFRKREWLPHLKVKASRTAILTQGFQKLSLRE